MKAGISFEGLAEYYDLIYKDKDYEREIVFIENIFDFTHKPKKILEFGCGTGNYSKILLERGYDVTGVDVSEKMLKIARKKCNCKFINGDIRDVAVNDKFDACIAMFNVMGYLTRNSEIVKALKNVHRHLKPNGIFIFDVWNGLTVMRLLPERRVKEVGNDNVKVIRYALPTLISSEHICEVDYKLVVLNKAENTFKEINEKHNVRFYFPQEIKHYLSEAGFAILKMCPFLDLRGRIDENVWNIAVVARTVGGKV